MKRLATLTLLAVITAHAQSDLEVPADATPTPPPASGLPDLPPPPPQDAAPPASDSAVEPVTPPAEPINDAPLPSADPVSPDLPAAGSDTAQPAAEEAILESDEGYLIKDAPLNDIFQFLAKQAGRQYFHNIKINTPEYRVTGHLNDGDPLQQMEELAFMYGLLLYTKGNTVYALTQSQLTQLPSMEWTYQLRYLRPTSEDSITQLKDLLKPVLSPGTGIVNFEPKTNMIIIIDSAHRIEQVRNLLAKVDQPKGQIIVETKILRVNSKAAERVGVNWSSTLGQTGTTIEVARSLNAMFGIGDSFTDIPNSASGIDYDFAENANLVLSPVQLRGVLRALAEGGVATQVSNPTLITEDNEQGTIAIIDRVPIITTTTNEGGQGISSVSEEVRYKIDESDASFTDEPERHREIGISMVATPTLLPDGTIRMDLRPRSAQISEQVRSPGTGNVYPRVTESMISSITRVPNGYSLVVGGFYGEVESNDKTKVPLLGDLPLLNFFFKSRETSKEQASLVFIVTPTSYDPTSRTSTGYHSNRIQGNVNLTRDATWVDTTNPGTAHEPNLRRGIRGLRPKEEPYYPTTDAQQVESTPAAPFDSGSTKPRFSRARR
ncbi:MAG: hypothetical protein MUF31_13145 [Akkermansiaceae bacterium]|jgi:type II secretory pathway component GspD/PulD (secretin)|nr:hypothetical protein [Akkermansiaceae bacterium]